MILTLLELLTGNYLEVRLLLKYDTHVFRLGLASTFLLRVHLRIKPIVASLVSGGVSSFVAVIAATTQQLLDVEHVSLR